MAYQYLSLMILGHLSACTPLAFDKDVFNNASACFGVYDKKPVDAQTHKFTLPQGTLCWDFCAADTECQSAMVALSFINECILFKEVFSGHPFEVFVQNGDYLILQKECYERNKIWRTITQKAETDNAFLIKKLDEYFCTEFEMEEDAADLTKDNQHRLTWQKNCNHGWQIKVTEINEKHSCQHALVSTNNGSLCLTTAKGKGALEKRRTVLNKCDSEGIYLCAEAENTWSIKMVLPQQGLVNLVTRDSTREDDSVPVYMTLTNLTISSNWFPCVNVSAIHGTIQREAGVPFYLPGETITVICDEGYGRQGSDGNFNQQFTTRCESGARVGVLECFPTPKSKKPCSRADRTPALLFFVILLAELIYAF